jgi:hypothetical protein
MGSSLFGQQRLIVVGEGPARATREEFLARLILARLEAIGAAIVAIAFEVHPCTIRTHAAAIEVFTVAAEWLGLNELIEKFRQPCRLVGHQDSPFVTHDAQGAAAAGEI